MMGGSEILHKELDEAIRSHFGSGKRHALSCAPPPGFIRECVSASPGRDLNTGRPCFAACAASVPINGDHAVLHTIFRFVWASRALTAYLQHIFGESQISRVFQDSLL